MKDKSANSARKGYMRISDAASDQLYVQIIQKVGVEKRYQDPNYSAKKLAEDILDRKVINMYPMEFVDNEKVFNKNTLVIGISHAGRSSSQSALPAIYRRGDWHHVRLRIAPGVLPCIPS